MTSAQVNANQRSQSCERILRGVIRARVLACLPALAFGVLAAVLGASGYVPWSEVGWALVAVIAGCVPSAWLAPGGWRRRTAEASLFVAALALTMIADPTIRRMTLPALLATSAGLACLAALKQVAAPRAAALVAAFALAVRAAGGLGLTGEPWFALGLALVAPPVLAATASWRIGSTTGMVVAALTAALPLQREPLAALTLLAAAVGLALVRNPLGGCERWMKAWAPLLGSLVPVVLTVSPWGGLPLTRALPDASWPALAAVITLLIAAPRVHRALLGAGWLATTLLLGPVQGTPDVGGLELTASQPSQSLPAGTYGRYTVEVALANGGGLPVGTPVATILIGPQTVPIRAGIETAEWAHQRPDVISHVRHPLPEHPAWRPSSLGRSGFWGVAGRNEIEVPAGVTPVIERAPELPAPVVVVLPTAGPVRPASSRTWPTVLWLLAGALAVGTLQLAGAARAGAAPWLLLSLLSIAARVPVEPLGVLTTRHTIDLVLCALLLAWLPAVRGWLLAGRVFLSAAALTVPLAVAAAQLAPSGVDERYHLLLMRSLVADHDVAIDNNLDLELFPENQIFANQPPAHSPALACGLLPGYLVAGRQGVLVLLALAGAAVAALSVRALERLGVARSRQRMLFFALLLTYPLVTYSTQLWVEIPGALLAAFSLLAATAVPPRWLSASLVGLVATTIKTRLGIAAFASTLGELLTTGFGRRRKQVLVPFAFVLVGVLSGLLAGWVVYGHPLGPLRRFHHLLAVSPQSALTALGGLLFDPAGGLFFSAPLLALSLLGLAWVWRKGSAAARGLIVGLAVTVVLLWSSPEWYGGGCPPGRYLVPFLPLLALGLGCLLGTTNRARPLLFLVLPFSIFVWWAFVTRPYLAFNPGDGGWWLASALARRLDTDMRWLIPSFLRPSATTWIVSIAVVTAVVLALRVVRARPALARTVARSTVALMLVLAASLIAWASTRCDAIVELEDPQVVRSGGQLEPPPGTFSRFMVANGWRIGHGDWVDLALRLPSAPRVTLNGSLVELRPERFQLRVGWDGAQPSPVGITAVDANTLVLPAPQDGGKHRLHIVLDAPAGGAVVLDRVVIEP